MADYEPLSSDAPRHDGREEGDPALPPVVPPSAGFIIQLFVLPALIVLAVVGVWALFGKIAASDEDWRALVEDIRNTNEHRRWRGAYGLATLLDQDQRGGASGQNLASNPEIARVLVDLFQDGLNKRTQLEDDLKQEAFVARTLGLLDANAIVLPALERGMKAEFDRDVRKNAIASIAVIAGRADAAGRPIDSPTLVTDLVAATSDSDSLIRDSATYALGLVPTDRSQQRLKVLVAGGDANTRINAAVGLARQKSTDGFAVFTQVLKDASVPPADPSAPHEVEALLAVKNSLLACRELAGKWTPDQRSQLVALIEPISKNHVEPRIRTDAIEALVALRPDSR